MRTVKTHLVPDILETKISFAGRVACFTANYSKWPMNITLLVNYTTNNIKMALYYLPVDFRDNVPGTLETRFNAMQYHMRK